MRLARANARNNESRRATPVSSPHLSHPAPEKQSHGGTDARDQQNDPDPLKREYILVLIPIIIPPIAQPFAVTPDAVAHEKPIVRPMRNHEYRTEPLNRQQHLSHKNHTQQNRYCQKFEKAPRIPRFEQHQINRHRRKHQQQRERQRHHVRDRAGKSAPVSDAPQTECQRQSISQSPTM